MLENIICGTSQNELNLFNNIVTLHHSSIQSSRQSMRERNETEILQFN